jgi:hypothetical protein
MIYSLAQNRGLYPKIRYYLNLKIPNLIAGNDPEYTGEYFISLANYFYLDQ